MKSIQGVPMAEEPAWLPRDCAALEAIEPHAGKTWQLLLRHKKIDETARRGMGATRELAFTLPWAIMNPTAIFRGIREEASRIGFATVPCPRNDMTTELGNRGLPSAGESSLSTWTPTGSSTTG